MPQVLIVTCSSSLKLLHISLSISYEKLVLNQDNNFYMYLISLSILISCLVDKVWILSREISFQSLLGAGRLLVMNMIFSDIETFILDINVGPIKKLASGDLTVIKRCKSDYHLISPHNISPESLIK